MAQISYNESLEFNAGDSSRVSFFSLPKDGDEAIVRFLHNDVSDFVILTRHDVGQGKQYRTVNCLRTPRDPIDACPFCASNINLKQSFYIHLLQYSKDENGNIVVSPKVWERSTAFATKLKGYIDNYGPLSDIMCKIVRHGTGLQTEYEIIPNLNKQIYRDDLYPLMPELFDGYTIVGNAVMDKSAEDMRVFLQTGAFPELPKQNNSSHNTVTANANVPFTYNEPTPVEVVPAYGNVTPPQYMQNSDTGMPSHQYNPTYTASVTHAAWGNTPTTPVAPSAPVVNAGYPMNDPNMSVAPVDRPIRRYQ